MKINVVKPIEEYKIGDQASLKHQITEDDVRQFAKLTGDYNPLHLDSDFAQQTMLKKPVVYGMLSASFISTIIGMKIPGPGALWTSQTLEFLHQVYVNDTLEIIAKVRQISLATRSLVLEIVTYNQKGQIILKGNATVKILESEDDNMKEKNIVERKKVCLITGGTSDIGKSIALNLVEKGFSVALNYNNSEMKAEYIKDCAQDMKGEIFLYKADISNLEETNNMINKIENEIGSICYVVHCAAPHNVLTKFDDLKWESFQSQINIQVGGFYNCLKKILPEMVRKQINGRVLLIGSIAVDGTPPAQQYDYILAKAACIAFAKSLAVEFGPKGIAVNIISPGLTETERTLDLPQKAKLMTKMQTPSRRLIDINEIAEAAAFLITQKSCAITGETLRICGGITMV